MKRSGFTLIELLAVLAVIAVLVTLGSRIVRSARLSARKAQAQVEMQAIETAVKAYLNRYGKMPSGRLVRQGAADIVFGYGDEASARDQSRAILSILTVADDSDAADNPSEIAFLEPQSVGRDGTFLDPWGEQYRIALDADYDGRIAIAGEELRRKVAVASVGLYLKTGSTATNDIVKSWL